jgi:hypothetical protein
MPALVDYESTRGGLLERVMRLGDRDAQGRGDEADPRGATGLGNEAGLAGMTGTGGETGGRAGRRRRTEPRRSLTLRLPEPTLLALKARADVEGLPYQTLAAMVLQKYLRGAFLDRDAVREVVKSLVP